MIQKLGEDGKGGVAGDERVWEWWDGFGGQFYLLTKICLSTIKSCHS